MQETVEEKKAALDQATRELLLTTEQHDQTHSKLLQNERQMQEVVTQLVRAVCSVW